MIPLASAAIGLAIAGGALDAGLATLDAGRGALLVVGCALAAFAANRAVFHGGEFILRPMESYALALLVTLCLALAAAGITAYVAWHATGAAQLLCAAGAVLPPVAALIGWRTGRRPEPWE